MDSCLWLDATEEKLCLSLNQFAKYLIMIRWLLLFPVCFYLEFLGILKLLYFILYYMKPVIVYHWLEFLWFNLNQNKDEYPVRKYVQVHQCSQPEEQHQILADHP